MDQSKSDPDKTSSDREIYSDIDLKLYPERRPDKYKASLFDKFFYGGDGKYYTSVCEYKVIKAFKENPLVRTLAGALKKNGCPVDIKRHIVCENCNEKIAGGFDSEMNQIVLCKNVLVPKANLEFILIHELIHMYDYCVNNVDFKNLEHLACTEIRAANLTDCGFLHSLMLGESTLFNIKETHQYCVKTKAAQSLATARNLEFPIAAAYILKVFKKCYNDLEPFGRRIRRNAVDPVLVEKESKHFGMCDS